MPCGPLSRLPGSLSMWVAGWTPWLHPSLWRTPGEKATIHPAGWSSCFCGAEYSMEAAGSQLVERSEGRMCPQFGKLCCQAQQALALMERREPARRNACKAIVRSGQRAANRAVGIRITTQVYRRHQRLFKAVGTHKAPERQAQRIIAKAAGAEINALACASRVKEGRDLWASCTHSLSGAAQRRRWLRALQQSSDSQIQRNRPIARPPIPMGYQGAVQAIGHQAVGQAVIQ